MGRIMRSGKRKDSDIPNEEIMVRLKDPHEFCRNISDDREHFSKAFRVCVNRDPVPAGKNTDTLDMVGMLMRDEDSCQGSGIYPDFSKKCFSFLASDTGIDEQTGFPGFKEGCVPAGTAAERRKAHDCLHSFNTCRNGPAEISIAQEKPHRKSLVYLDTMITIEARAKLNLTLGVLYRRTDGYHALDSIMVETELSERIRMEKSTGILVLGTGKWLPYQNTLRKAAAMYWELTGHGAEIRIRKTLPMQAGMGGGSADAAAVLRGMNAMYGYELDEKTLSELALQVGADVPFCLHGGLCRAEGVGEILTPLSGPEMWFAIAKPAAGVSTKALFSALKLPRKNPDTHEMILALKEGRLDQIGTLLHNALEEPAAELVPAVRLVRERLLEAGAYGAAMTGSGSAVFGLFGDREAAECGAEAAAELVKETFVTRFAGTE